MKIDVFSWRSFVIDKALVVNRVLVSASLLIVHGLGKLDHLKAGTLMFPDPFGFGPVFTFYFACFATIFCPLLIMAGLLTRLAACVTLGVTLTGLLLVHASDALAVRDTPYIYSVALLTIFLLGPGRYSVDHWISNRKLR